MRSIKQFFIWTVALGGLAFGALLLLTGRGVAAISTLLLLGPLIWSWWREQAPVQPPGGPGRGPGWDQRRRTGPFRGGAPFGRAAAGMTREEAYAVLGLAPGASEAEIRAAYVRLMRAAHPDNGGSDWLASRINQARDVLLRR